MLAATATNQVTDRAALPGGVARSANSAVAWGEPFLPFSVA